MSCRAIVAFVAIIAVVVCRGTLAEATAGAGDGLQAIFMEVDGKVRWRQGENDPWRNASVNDLVNPGAEIRTGLRSRATLRVGKNASILVDAGTAFQLPTVVREGDTLRTLAAVKSGRVDFKVDKLDGFTNDFKVITPQTTLSVRGTGFAVTNGVLNGVEVAGARTNMINAIELKYVAGNLQYFLSGDAKSSSGQQDPVKGAWISTLGPPQVVGTIVDGAQLEQAASQGGAGNAPTNPQQSQQIAAAETNSIAAGNALATADSAVEGLLTMQSRASEAAGEAADAARRLARNALRTGEDAIAAAETREPLIQAVLAKGDDLDAAWVGEGGLQSELGELHSRSGSDLLEMGSLRTQLDEAINAEVGSQGNDGAGFAKMDAMHAIDDAWQGGLLGRAREIVLAVQSLNADLQEAHAAAVAADSNFSALKSSAEKAVSVASSAAGSLAALRSAVQGYRDDIRRLVASGQAGAGAVASLVRSAELLESSVGRIERALQAMQNAEEALMSANTLGERVLLSAAIAVATHGGQVQGLAEDQLAVIEANVSAIENARFSAFFAAAAAAVAAVPGERDSAIASRDEANQAELDLRPLADAAEAPAALVRQLAGDLDTFWNQPDAGETVSRKVRMENLKDQSVTDLAAIQGLLGQLTTEIDASNQSKAAEHLASMQGVAANWEATGTNLLSAARTIDADVQTLNAGVQDAYTAFDTGSGGAYAAKLAQVISARGAAKASSDRLEAMRDKFAAYLVQYQQITGEGGRGSAYATQLATTIASIEAVQGQIQDSLDASVAAQAAADRATTYGAKVFFVATSQKALDSAEIARRSSELRTQIEQNATSIRDSRDQGQTNYDNKFGSGGGGNGG